jgi:hypothetical protein
VRYNIVTIDRGTGWVEIKPQTGKRKLKLWFPSLRTLATMQVGDEWTVHNTQQGESVRPVSITTTAGAV